MPVPTWVRVRDENGHEFDVRSTAVRDNHKRLNSKEYPDIEGYGRAPRPAKPAEAKRTKSSSASADGSATSKKEAN